MMAFWSEFSYKLENKVTKISGICILKKILPHAQIMKFSIKDFFSKCDQIRILLRI